MNDLRFAFRQLVKNPGFTAVAVLTLALGIGATTAITSVVRTVLFDPIPAAAPDRLVRLAATHRLQGWSSPGLNPAALLEVEAKTNLFARLGVFEFDRLNLKGDLFPLPLDGMKVTPDFFRLWQVRPELGREFADDEGRAGQDLVIVLSHRIWQNRFGGDPGIIGRSVTFNEGSFTVVGVMPPHFHYLPGAGFWRPFAGPKTRTAAPGHPADSAGEYLPNTGVIAELRPGVGREQVEAMLAVVQQRQSQESDYMKDFDLRAVPLLDSFLSPEVRRTFWALFGSIVVLLFIACSNVANLQLARVETRQPELAIRVALGARRWRIFRQLLIESVLLSLLGGVAGLVLTGWSMPLLERLVPDWLPRLKPVALDGGVFALSFLVSLATGVVFGLVPAWRACRTQVNNTLKVASTTTTRGTAGAWVARSLVVGQVALAMVLLVGAGLMIRSVEQQLHSDMGFDPKGLSVVYPAFDLNHYLNRPDTASAIDALFSDMRIRVAALPGVVGVGVALEGGTMQLAALPGAKTSEIGEYFTGTGTEDALQVFGAPLKSGRWLDRGDEAQGGGRVLINEAAARRLFPGMDPIGRKLWQKTESGSGSFEIVGLVGNIADHPPEAEPRPKIYLSIVGHPVFGPSRFLVVRTAGNQALSTVALARELKAAGADMAPPMILDKESQIQIATAPNRTFMSYLLAFAGTGVVLAALGLYGVLTFNVTRRAREIGIRLALGAARQDVVELIVGQGMRLATAGVALGLLGAFFAGRLLQGLLFNTSTTDPFVFLAVALVLVATALLACWLPARRAARVDPMVALRSE
jgi:putative ABC transport system permease protein